MTLNTEMTPRARRMIVYCAVGFSIYLFVCLAETIQNLHLNRLDAQLKALDSQVDYGGN